MPIPFIRKTSAEACVIGLDFTDDIPEGVTIASCECSARVRRTEEDVTSTLLSNGTTAVISEVANTAKITVSDGERGTMYEIIFTVTLSDAQTIVGRHLVMVDE